MCTLSPNLKIYEYSLTRSMGKKADTLFSNWVALMHDHRKHPLYRPWFNSPLFSTTQGILRSWLWTVLLMITEYREPSVKKKKLETVQTNVFAVLWKELEKSCVPCLKDSCFANDLTIVVTVKKTDLFTNAKAVQFYLASIL